MPIFLHSKCRFLHASFAAALFVVALISGCGNDPTAEGQAVNNSADSSTALTPEPTGNDLVPQTSEDPPIPPQDGTRLGTTESQQAVAETVTPGPVEPKTTEPAVNDVRPTADTPATKSPIVGASEEVEDPPKVSRPVTPKDEVYTAIDDAIRRLQVKDYPGFIKYYLQVDVIRELRSKSAMSGFLSRIKQDPASFNRVTELLKRARKATPEFNDTFTEVTLRIIEKPVDGKPAAVASEGTAPKTTNVKLAGFGSDLDVAIGKAVAALEKGDVELFVTNMFPAGELRHPDAKKRRALVVGRMKANPAPVQQMIADLKAIKGKTPTMEAKGSVASFQLEGGMIVNGQYKVKLPTRTFKLQKAENSWRLYDRTTAIRKEVAMQVTLPLPKFTPQGGKFVKLEKIGDSWRILMLNF
ncbi:MAG: hypothetical protein HOL01_09680 [Planctomycetaceae bacterium]|jgi:hypothetical protein|nr:hypothetical protein [Planctomycetaceae bacterium]MBT6486864.1 hypothetical protein [Planctomycetaceae bacterium]MBT6494807.1 hypothetical protein [Planctomycetaceae bacterium]